MGLLHHHQDGTWSSLFVTMSGLCWRPSWEEEKKFWYFWGTQASPWNFFQSIVCPHLHPVSGCNLEFVMWTATLLEESLAMLDRKIRWLVNQGRSGHGRLGPRFLIVLPCWDLHGSRPRCCMHCGPNWEDAHLGLRSYEFRPQRIDQERNSQSDHHL